MGTPPYSAVRIRMWEKYYLNEQFSGLPESIKQELQIMCVMYTEDIGGIILLEFMPDGRLQFKVEAEENDYLFDEIGSALKSQAVSGGEA